MSPSAVPRLYYTKDRSSQKRDDPGEIDAVSFLPNRPICKTDAPSPWEGRGRVRIFGLYSRTPSSDEMEVFVSALQYTRTDPATPEGRLAGTRPQVIWDLRKPGRLYINDDIDEACLKLEDSRRSPHSQ